MPLDGTDYQPEITLEEKALRHALAYFSGPEKWWRAGKPTPEWELGMERTCIGIIMCRFLVQHDPLIGRWTWIDKTLAVPEATAWNDNCPSFATMIAHLKSRIKYYEDERMKVAA